MCLYSELSLFAFSGKNACLRGNQLLPLSLFVQAGILCACIIIAVADMLHDLPFNLDANNDMCFQKFGIRA